jgi:hypothetical protein
MGRITICATLFQLQWDFASYIAVRRSVIMIRRSITALALAACIAAPVASFAATSSSDKSAENNANIAPAKGPMVHVTLKNMSNLTQNLVIQGRPVVLEANEARAVDVPAGTQVMGADNVVKLTVVKEYNGAVASFR